MGSALFVLCAGEKKITKSLDAAEVTVFGQLIVESAVCKIVGNLTPSKTERPRGSNEKIILAVIIDFNAFSFQFDHGAAVLFDLYNIVANDGAVIVFIDRELVLCIERPAGGNRIALGDAACIAGAVLFADIFSVVRKSDGRNRQHERYDAEYESKNADKFFGHFGIPPYLIVKQL